VLAVLHLDPIGASPAAIGAIDALRQHSLESHIAGSVKQVGADLALLEWRDENAIGPSRKQPRQASPSMTNCSILFLSAASTIHG
jgi:hypothetical protein